ncbi:MAG: hypothetical protein E7186_07730 [Erysipelotrichaceae bacterium]|jgi:cell division protein FtsL|nr:hypothetical protein [Erysipelotrichaceae bacterium]
MKKVVKKRRTLKLTGVIFVMFMVSFVVFLGSSIFLKSYNVSMNYAKYQLEAQISRLRTENEILKFDIRELGNYDRIANIINAENMSVNETHVRVIEE